MDMKKILNIILISCLSLLFVGCKDDEPQKPSIFIDDTSENAITADFDKWLVETYTKRYNVDFQYKLVDSNTDESYNLSPTDYERSKELAHVINYLWFDVYSKVVYDDFLKLYGPRIIMLVGSYAVNASNHTITLGTAEGGIKVTLYGMNELKMNDINMLNEFIFETMHHEFSHILHQTKVYPKEFEQLTPGSYSPTGWQNRTDKEARQMGFVGAYASSQPREDFVETIARYITNDDEGWEKILADARQGEVTKGVTGEDMILQKWEIARTWLADKWQISLEDLRAEVQLRQKNLIPHYQDILNDDFSFLDDQRQNNAQDSQTDEQSEIN